MPGISGRAAVRLFLALAALGVVGGCGDSGTGAYTPSSVDLDGHTFSSTSVTGHDLVKGSRIELGFENGIMSVWAGCNHQFDAYEVVDDILSWSGTPGSTLKACSSELTEQDRWLADFFDGGATATLDGSTLTLTRGDVTLALAK